MALWGGVDAMFMTPEKQNKGVFIDDEPTIEPTTGKEKEAKAKAKEEEEHIDPVSELLSEDKGVINIEGNNVKVASFKEGKVKGSYIIKGKIPTANDTKSPKKSKQYFYEVTYNPSKRQFEPIRQLSFTEARKAIKPTRSSSRNVNGD